MTRLLAAGVAAAVVALLSGMALAWLRQEPFDQSVGLVTFVAAWAAIMALRGGRR